MKNFNNIVEKVTSLLDDPAQYLRANESLQNSWLGSTKSIYDFTKSEEQSLSLSTSQDALTSLHIDGFGPEEIWQQIELQNCALLSTAGSVEAFTNESNLCWMVASVSGIAKDGLEGDTVGELQSDDDDEGEEEKEELEEEEKFKENSEEEGESVDEGVETGEEEGESNVEEDHDNDSNDGDLFEGLDGEGDESFSDLDADTFGDIALEGDEGSDESSDGEKEDHSDNEGEEKNQLESGGKGSDSEDDLDFFQEEDNKAFRKKKKSKLDLMTKFETTSVDSKFLNLRESEWIADNDILGENYDLDDGDSDLDLMQDIDDQEEGGSEATSAMYGAFFDEPLSQLKEISQISPRKSKKPLSENLKEKAKTDTVVDDNHDIERNDTDEIGLPTKLIGHEIIETKSRFEEERENELKLFEELESENLSEKPWIHKGEVLKDDRPENSTLEEHLDYNVHVRQKPIITEDTTSLLEKMILSRIRTQDFDDVERRIKPNLDPFEFKKKLILDQEQSKKGLAELYEEDYVKKLESESTSESKDTNILTKTDKPEEELPEHKEIRACMDNLFAKLEALSNYHYTPLAKNAELRIVSNLPAISVEESTPVTASDATLLAPQEIVAPVKGPLKGATELTKTDKLSNRRRKKARQKNISNLREDRLKEKAKKERREGKDGLMGKGTSAKVVEKAIKKGQIKTLEGDDKSTKSSTKFFEKLQSNINKHVESKNKKRKFGETKDGQSFKKKVKTSKEFSAAKLLL